MTRVVSVRGKKREEMELDPLFRYVGRAVRYTTWTEKSPFANPFWNGITLYQAVSILKPMGYLPSQFETPVNLFSQWIIRRPDLLTRLHTLRGKTLGCWCGCWAPGEPEIGCHAVILARLADALELEVQP